MFKTLVKIVLLLDNLFFEGFSFELQFHVGVTFDFCNSVGSTPFGCYF